MLNPLLGHLNDRNILAEEQTRFKGNLTTEEASYELTLTLLTWRIWRAPTNARKWRMGINSAFKGLSNEMVNALNNESVQGGIFRDSTKLLRTVNHDTSLNLIVP